MGIDEGIMLAPLDPAFRPTFEMFCTMCDFLVSTGLSDETSEYTSPYERVNKFLRIDDIKLFPKRYTFLEPSQWTQANLEIYNRMFDFETDNEGVDYYLDENGLRNEREYLPTTGFLTEDWYFRRNELNKLEKYFNERYLLTMNIPLGSRPKREINELGFANRGGTIYIRYGFHFEENSSIWNPEQDQEYLRLFPYAPQALREADHEFKKNSDLLLTYAGCFSLTIYTLLPLFFEKGQSRWPENLTEAENLARFKTSSSFYIVLKPGLEEILQQPVDIFIGRSV